MTMVEKKEEIQTKGKKSEPIYRIYPDMNIDVNYNKKVVEVEIALPGVSKENITLKALPTWFQLVAKRENIEYCADQSWGVDIVPEKTTAEYSNGLLKVHAVIKDPLDGAKEFKF